MQDMCINLLIHTGPLFSYRKVPSALSRRTGRHTEVNSLIYALFLLAVFSLGCNVQVRGYIHLSKVFGLTSPREGNPSAQKHQRLRPLESIARVKPPAPGMLSSIPVLDEIRDKPGRGRELPFVEAVLVCIIKAAKNQWK